MGLSIEKRTEDGIAILGLEGSLTLGPLLVELRNAARDILARPNLTGIILDVEKVTSIDSSGLGEMTIVYSYAGTQKCSMRLIGVSPNLHKMLKMTHLDKILLAADNLETAKKQLKSFRASA